MLADARRREIEMHGDELGAQVKEQQAAEELLGMDVSAELARCFERVNLLFDACDRWLRDPDDDTRYDIGPRADDVWVIYEEPGIGGKPVRRKATITELLSRLEEGGYTVRKWETKYADPRELVLKAANQLQGQIDMLARLLKLIDDKPSINVLVGSEWLSVRSGLLEALAPYPEAKVAVATALLALEGRHNGH